MAPVPIQYNAGAIDLSPRLFASSTVVGSPTDNTETIVASVTCTGDIAVVSGILVWAWAAFTVGTNGVSVNLKIRRTDASGSTRAATGAVNEGVTAATQLGYRYAQAFDTGPTMPGQVYVATLTVASGSAASTVSAVSIAALVV
jgi:hypothetical protein